MTSRKRKNQKLRHEVSEYTSLIRVLHTTSAQDIVPHLTGRFVPPSRSSSPTSGLAALGPPQSPERVFQDQQAPEDNSDDISDYINRSSSHNSSDVSEGEPKKKAHSNRVWTRWPLLQSDVYVPEFTLQDEIRSIAEVTARKWVVEHPEETEDDPLPETDDRQSSDGRSSEEIERALETVQPLPEEEILTKGVINGLTLESVNLLSHIFAALVAHRPAVDKSLQNRLKCMDWKAVVRILGASAIVSPEVLRVVEGKMESIYGRPGGRNASPMNIKRNPKRKLKEIEESLGSRIDLLHFMTNPPSRKRRRRLKSEN